MVQFDTRPYMQRAQLSQQSNQNMMNMFQQLAAGQQRQEELGQARIDKQVSDANQFQRQKQLQEQAITGRSDAAAAKFARSPEGILSIPEAQRTPEQKAALNAYNQMRGAEQIIGVGGAPVRRFLPVGGAQPTAQPIAQPTMFGQLQGQPAEPPLEEGYAPAPTGLSLKSQQVREEELVKQSVKEQALGRKREFDVKKARKFADKSWRSFSSNYKNMSKTIKDASGMVGRTTAGFGGSIMGLIPGTDATDLEIKLKTIGADAAFSELQEMRNNSPSGGALGSVSERELGLLTNAKSQLDQAQSPEALKAGIDNYGVVRDTAFRNVAEAYKDTFGEYPEGFKVPDEAAGGLSDDKRARLEELRAKRGSR